MNADFTIPLTGYGKIIAGSDANGLWPIFTAGAEAVWICNGSIWGGAAGEITDLYLLTPGQMNAGASDASKYGGSEINAYNVWDGIKAGGATNLEKHSLFNGNGDYGGGR